MARVQSKAFTDAAQGLSQDITFDDPTTTGHTIIVLVYAFKTAGGATDFTVDDNKSNPAFDLDVRMPDPSAQFNMLIFSLPRIVTGGSSHTVTVHSSAVDCYFHLVMAEYPACDLEDTSSFESTGTTVAPGVVTSTGEGVVVSGVFYETAQTVTEDAAFDLIAEDESNGYSAIDVLTLVGGGPIGPDWELGASAAWHAVAAAYLNAPDESRRFLLVRN